MKLSSSNRLLVKNYPHSEPALFSTSTIPPQEPCHDANCTWRSFTARAFCNSLLHIRDSPECLKTNILPVPLSITLAEKHHISISLRRGSPLAIRSPPPRPRCLYWRRKGEHERANQTRGIRAVTGACRMQSVIRNTAEPDPLVLCPSHRQSYPFNSLWLSITHKQQNNACVVNFRAFEYAENIRTLLMVW